MGLSGPDPAWGTLFYEIGYKREEPSGPIVVSRVYCGRVNKNGQEFHLLVEFRRWWNMKQTNQVIGPDDGLLVRDLGDLQDAMKNWEQVSAWVAENRMNWRERMKLG